MQSYRAAVAAIALMVTLSLAGAAGAAGMKPEWIGAYGYEDGREAVAFYLSLSQNGKVITGHISETQTFGETSPDGSLRAKIVGSVDGHKVVFTKTYDGTGGQSHSVTYRGTLVAEGEYMFMFGTWRIGSEVGSWFASVTDE